MTPRAWTVSSPPVTATPATVTVPLASRTPPFSVPVSPGTTMRSPSKRIGPAMSEAITRGLRITISPASRSTRPTTRGASGVPLTRRSSVAMPSTDSCGDSTENGRRPGVPVSVTSRVVVSPKVTLPPTTTGSPALKATSSK